MTDLLRPPIPATCASRPTISGVVAPWVNVALADGGVDFRSQHNTKTQRCWKETRCQVCSKTIGHPIVLLGGPRQVRALQFDEPPLHPECAVYTSQACPMVAGRQAHYAKRDVISNGSRGHVCPDTDCDCGGWIPTPGITASADGAPAHDWYAVYVSGYSLGIKADQPNLVHSGVVARDQVLTIRHVSTPAVGRIWKRVPAESVIGGHP